MPVLEERSRSGGKITQFIRGLSKKFGSLLGAGPRTTEIQATPQPQAPRPRQQARTVQKSTSQPRRTQSTSPAMRPQATPQPVLNERVPEQLIDPITQAAQQRNIPVDVFSNLLARESMGFRPDVLSGALRSPVGAMGIAQFMPQTLGELQRLGYGQIDPFNPQQAIPASAFYLDWLNQQFEGNLPLAIAAYNAGIGNVQGAMTRSGSENIEDVLPLLPLETQNYVPAVLGTEPALSPSR